MSQITSERVRWTTSDIELLTTDEWKRYEIIDGELFVTRAPHWQHQGASGNIYLELQIWSRTTFFRGSPFYSWCNFYRRR